MIVTVLAVCFLVTIGIVVYFGYKLVFRPPNAAEDLNTEKCSLCRERFDKSKLILRQVGDYKLLYFCRKCLEGLQNEAKAKSN
ncbi:MAG: hypothetical protein ACHQQQ_01050 [Bacteroidota bacterium]